MKSPDLQAIRSEISYDPATGEFRWLRPKQGRRVGGLAGSVPSEKSQWYSLIRAGGALVSAHRLAWAMHYGAWPDQILDHINGVRSDNRITNLRLADNEINTQNRHSASSQSTTGLLGVTRYRAKGRAERFRGRIYVGGKQRYLGSFDTPQEAHQAYLDAKRKHHPGCTI